MGSPGLYSVKNLYDWQSQILRIGFWSMKLLGGNFLSYQTQIFVRNSHLALCLWKPAVNSIRLQTKSRFLEPYRPTWRATRLDLLFHGSVSTSTCRRSEKKIYHTMQTVRQLCINYLIKLAQPKISGCFYMTSDIEVYHKKNCKSLVAFFC